MILRSGRAENVPYSLSRWTDVPAAKWDWFKLMVADKKMAAIDPRTGVPGWWSLKPDDTLGMVFWTKDPTNLLIDRELLRPYNVKVHVTVTGWVEVEKGAPDLETGAQLLANTAKAYGPENVTWRFSPVPVLEFTQVLGRFRSIAEVAVRAGIKSVFVSFLQTNDLMTEPRDWAKRLSLLAMMSRIVEDLGLEVRLCNEDRTLERWVELAPFLGEEEEDWETSKPQNLDWGVCATPTDWGQAAVTSEGCGCVLMADPFTVNESCTFGCTYCYASDKSLADKKRNTTRSLPVVR